MTTSDISIRRVESSADRRDWLRVPHVVFAGDPSWIAPLHMVEKQRISARHNPFFETGEAAFFVARRQGQVVGRISAQHSRRYLEHHRDATGQFGFFDCIDDVHVARALIDAAAAWLRACGLTRMIGPFNLSINEESGLLVEGFDHAPAIMTSHAPRYAGALLEGCDLRKAMDLLSYRVRPQNFPKQLHRLSKLAEQSERVRVRTIDMRKYADEVAIAFDIFNDAWSDNWGFVPIGRPEIDAMVRDTRPIMRGKFGYIAEIDGVPAAMMILLPDINAVIRSFGGRLLPFNWAKLVRAVWADQWTSARIPLLGIRKAFRGTPLAPAVLSLVIAQTIELSRTYDLGWIEFSWVLETNRAMTALGELSAGPPIKRHRIYELVL